MIRLITMSEPLALLFGAALAPLIAAGQLLLWAAMALLRLGSACWTTSGPHWVNCVIGLL